MMFIINRCMHNAVRFKGVAMEKGAINSHKFQLSIP